MNKFLSLISFLLFFCISTKAQMVSGTVYEPDGVGRRSLPGANVYWKDSQIGIMTDENGYFELFHPEKYNQLIISFVGFVPDTILISKKVETIQITLQPGTNIGEVQIVKRTPGTYIDRMAPIVSEMITGAELCKAACCNLSESFETNASVDAYYSNAITGARQIRMLGLDGAYVQLLTENLPSFRGIATSYGLLYIPGPWMESIQISKGTSSVKNGYESIAGQINVEYQKPTTADKIYLNLFGSNAGRAEVNLVSSAILNNELSTLFMAHFSDDSYSQDHNMDDFMDEPLVRQYNFLNRWYYSKDNWRFIALARYLNESRYSGSVNYQPGDYQDVDQPYGIGVKTNRAEAFLKVGYVFDNPLNSSIGTMYSLTLHDQNSFYGTRSYLGNQFTYYMNLMFQTDLRNEKHTLTTGFSLNLERYIESLDLIENRRFESVPGIFSEYAFKPNERFTMLAGLRLDYHNLYGLMITPRVHAKFNIDPSTHLRLSAGKGSRTPYVLAENNHFLANSRRIIIDADLNQEVAWNYGVNLTRYFLIGDSELTLMLEVYRTDFVNQIIVDLDTSVDEVRFFNLDGKSFSNNFQVETAYQIFRGMDVKAAFRYSDVRYSLSSELVEKPLVGKYKGLLTLSYQTPLKKWQFDLTNQLNGPGRIPSTASNPVEYQMEDSFPAFFIMNAQITKYFRKWDFYVGVENLTNYRQQNAVIAPDQPYGEFFDASLVWGPVHGRKIYAGLRFGIGRE